MLLWYYLVVGMLAYATKAAVITSMDGMGMALIIIDDTMPEENVNQENNINYQMALKLFTIAEETSQSIEEVYKSYFSGFHYTPENTHYCYYNPFYSNIYDCDVESLDEDMKLLMKINSLYASVLNYEETNGLRGYIAVQEMKHTRKKLIELIDCLKETLQLDGSGSNIEDVHYKNAVSSHCYKCNSIADQYKIIMEMKVIIGLTVNHSKCMKDKHMNN